MNQRCGVRSEAKAQRHQVPGKVLYCHLYRKCNCGLTSRSAATFSRHSIAGAPWSIVLKRTKTAIIVPSCEILACIHSQVNQSEFPRAALPEGSNQNAALSIHFAVTEAATNSRIPSLTRIP